MTSTPDFTIWARDFRVLRKTEFNPRGVCLLAGPNGSGKTTCLDVLNFLRNTYAHGHTEAVRLIGGGAFLRHMRADPQSAVVVGLRFGELTWEIELPIESGGVGEKPGELLRHGDRVLMRRAMFSDTIDLGDERRDADQRSGLQVLKWVKSPPEIEPLINFLGDIRVYKSYWLNRVREPQSTSDPTWFLHPTGQNLWNLLRTWKASPRRYRGQFEWVLRGLRDAFPDQIKDLEIDAIGQTVQARFYPPDAQTGDDYLPFALAAEGLCVGVLHLTAVAGAKNGSLLAFDEMEDKLHPHAIRSLLASMRALAAERDLTLVLTTHSPVLMNEFKGHEDQFHILEPGHETLPIPLDQARDPDWLAHFALGDLYNREDFAAPRSTP